MFVFAVRQMIESMNTSSSAVKSSDRPLSPRDMDWSFTWKTSNSRGESPLSIEDIGLFSIMVERGRRGESPLFIEDISVSSTMEEHGRRGESPSSTKDDEPSTAWRLRSQRGKSPTFSEDYRTLRRLCEEEDEDKRKRLVQEFAFELGRKYQEYVGILEQKKNGCWMEEQERARIVQNFLQTNKKEIKRLKKEEKKRKDKEKREKKRTEKEERKREKRLEKELERKEKKEQKRQKKEEKELETKEKKERISKEKEEIGRTEAKAPHVGLLSRLRNVPEGTRRRKEVWVEELQPMEEGWKVDDLSSERKEVDREVAHKSAAPSRSVYSTIRNVILGRNRVYVL